MIAYGSVLRMARVLPRGEFFAGLFTLGCVSGLASRIIQSVNRLGWADALFNTFEISVIVWISCAAGVSLVLRDRTIGPNGPIGSCCPSSREIVAGSCTVAEAPEADAPGFSRRQGRPGAIRDHPGFVLCDGRQDMDGKPIGLRKIDGLEFDARLHEVGDESHISGEPVQLGDDQSGTVEAACRKCLRKPWAVVSLAAFDLGVFGNQVSLAAQAIIYRLPLGIQAEAGFALSLGALHQDFVSPYRIVSVNRACLMSDFLAQYGVEPFIKTCCLHSS